jgi:CBS domain containing-hemolysin-like protein
MDGGGSGPQGSVAVLIGGLALAFGVSFFCSLMEAALLSLTPGQLARLKRAKPRMGAAMGRLKDDVQRPITVILALNTAAHTIGATVAGAEFAMIFGNDAIALFSALFTFLMLQYTEILPKSLGVRFNETISAWMALPLTGLARVLSPVIRLLLFLNRPFESHARAGSAALSLDEVVALAGHARLVHLITPQQENIITQAAYLSKQTAADIMVPVEQITFLSSDQTLPQAIITAHMDPHTRFPVVQKGNRDDVQGYVNFKELVYRVRTNPAEPTLHGVIRPVRFVPADMPCHQVLHAFVNEHEHMAIVRDAQSRTVGLITLEDVVEVLLGDLQDEFDRLPKMCHSLPKGVWIVGGGVPMSELAERLKMPAIAAEGTLSTWMMARLEGKLVVDQRLRVEPLEFTVRRIRRGKPFEVLISPVGPPLGP